MKKQKSFSYYKNIINLNLKLDLLRHKAYIYYKEQNDEKINKLVNYYNE